MPAVTNLPSQTPEQTPSPVFHRTDDTAPVSYIHHEPADGEPVALTFVAHDSDPTATPTESTESVTRTEPKHDKAKRIGVIKRWKTVHEIGKSARSHNKKIAGTINPEDGSVNGVYSNGAKANAKKIAREEIRQSNRNRRRIIRALIARGGLKQPELTKQISSHSKTRHEIVNADRAKAISHTGRAYPTRITSKSADSIRIRNANPQEGDQVLYVQGEPTVLPKSLRDRTEAAHNLLETYQQPANSPNELSTDDIPSGFKGDKATEVVRDIRNKLEAAMSIGLKQSRANGEPYDATTARAIILKNLTAGRNYGDFGIEVMGLRDAEIAKFVNRVMSMDSKEFDALFPKPEPKPRRTNDRTAINSAARSDTQPLTGVIGQNEAQEELRRQQLNSDWPTLLDPEALNALDEKISKNIKNELGSRGHS
ncbi:MAG: hypothetical protein M3Q36_00575, partial [bacterium]|nr:hypothetical protein [bacterium]